VVLTTKADERLLEKKDEDELKELSKIQQSFGEEELGNIIRDSVSLQTEQEKIQDFSALPSLKVSDIEPKEPIIPRETFQINGTNVTYFSHYPNGTSFLQLKFDTKHIDESLQNFLSIYEKFLPQLGTKTFKFDEFSE